MAKADDIIGILHQNLVDAGCDERMIGQCLDMAKEQKGAELLRILARQKGILIERVHREQKRIDCLDFLVYQLQRGNIFSFKYEEAL